MNDKKLYPRSNEIHIAKNLNGKVTFTTHGEIKVTIDELDILFELQEGARLKNFAIASPKVFCAMCGKEADIDTSVTDMCDSCCEKRERIIRAKYVEINRNKEGE